MGGRSPVWLVGEAATLLATLLVLPSVLGSKRGTTDVEVPPCRSVTSATGRDSGPESGRRGSTTSSGSSRPRRPRGSSSRFPRVPPGLLLKEFSIRAADKWRPGRNCRMEPRPPGGGVGDEPDEVGRPLGVVGVGKLLLAHERGRRPDPRKIA